MADTTIYEIPVGKSPVLGAKDAPVIITEFIDFQCPFCVREFPKIKEILKAYDGKVQVVFKHYPLMFHKKAQPMHAAVELALQEKGNDAFWTMHDLIMANPKKMEVSDLRGYAETVGLDMDRFDKVMLDAAAITKLLAKDRALAGKCKVRGTPTIMINGVKLTDRSINGYKTRVDNILSKTMSVAKK
jgi:protein-disulfide isomerase